MKFVIFGIDVSINVDVWNNTVKAQIVIPKDGNFYTEVMIDYCSTEHEQLKIGIHEVTWEKG